MFELRWRQDILNFLVDDAKAFFEVGNLKFFRVKACVYSYNKILKKGKSFVFLDFGLKEKSKENTFKVYAFYNERLNNNYIFFNRFYNYLPCLSLGLNCVDKQDNLLRDYFFISYYDFMQKGSFKYSENVVDIFYKSNNLLTPLFYSKLHDVDRWVSDYYPISLDKLYHNKVIIKDFTSYGGFYINRSEDIWLGSDYLKSFYNYWFCGFSNYYNKNSIGFLENKIFVKLKQKLDNSYFLKISFMLKSLFLKNNYIYCFFKNNIYSYFLLRFGLSCVFYLYRFIIFKFFYWYNYNKKIGSFILKIFNMKLSRLVPIIFSRNNLLVNYFTNVYRLKNKAFKYKHVAKSRKKATILSLIRQKFSYFMKVKTKFRYKVYVKGYKLLPSRVCKIPVWNYGWFSFGFSQNVQFVLSQVLKNFCFFIIFLYKRFFLYSMIGLCEKFVVNSFFWINNFFFIKYFFFFFFKKKLLRGFRYKKYKIEKIFKKFFNIYKNKKLKHLRKTFRRKQIYLSIFLKKKQKKSIRMLFFASFLKNLFKSKDYRLFKYKNIKIFI